MKVRSGTELAKAIRRHKGTIRINVNSNTEMWIKAHKSDLADIMGIRFGKEQAPFTLRYDDSLKVAYLCSETQLQLNYLEEI